MSLLNSNTEAESDDASQGEELTKGTSHVVLAAIIAALAVTAAMAIFVWAGEKPPSASGEILEVYTHPRHVTTAGYDANGEAMQQQQYDQILLFARVRIRNLSKNPIVMEDALANVTQADGIHSISAASKGQYDQVFVAYPEMKSFEQPGLPATGSIAPGQTAEGTLLWGMQQTREQWNQRKALDFTVRLQYLPSLKLSTAAAIGEK